MNCPVCKVPGTRVVATKELKDRVRRQRVCACGCSWWTKELFEKQSLRTGAKLLIDLDKLSNESTVEDFEPIPQKKIPSNPAQLATVTPIKPPTIFDRAVDLFCRLWKERHGTDYVSDFREEAEFGRFLQKVPRETLHLLPDAILDYLKDDWSRKERGHSMGWFARSGWFNRYRTRTAAAKSPTREIRLEPKKSPQDRGWVKPNGVNGHPTHIGELVDMFMEEKK